MSRKAVLIEASAVPGQDPLPGAARDVDTLKTWLMSNPGGAWEDGEIEVLRNPSVNLVRAHMLLARSAGYAFISFSGHGSHPHAGDFDDTEIAMKDGTLRAFELNCGAARCTVVVDACRYVGPEAFAETYQKAMGAVKFARDRTRESHRSLFDAAVDAADKGVVYMFSCDITEFAGESSLTGGYFTRFLAENGSQWYRAGADRAVMDTQSAYNRTRIDVTRRAPQQNPKYEPGRRQRHPPFAVRA